MRFEKKIVILAQTLELKMDRLINIIKRFSCILLLDKLKSRKGEYMGLKIKLVLQISLICKSLITFRIKKKSGLGFKLQ